MRNRLKIESPITNAQRFLNVQREYGTFDDFIWRFTGNRTLRTFVRLTMENMPAQATESEAMSKELKRRGFRFVGPTVCYAFMQAVGMVKDHVAPIAFSPPRASARP